MPPSRVLWFVLAVGTLGCNPSGEKSAPAPQTVSPRDLYNSYADGSERWTGRPVKVTLPPGNYVVSGSSLHWHPNRPTDAPGLVFHFATPPVAKEGEPVTLTGTCRGKRPDDGKRGSGFTWHVLVDGCAVR